jgi:hypothetical protein
MLGYSCSVLKATFAHNFSLSLFIDVRDQWTKNRPAKLDLKAVPKPEAE